MSVQKGDWVVIEGLDMLPMKLESDPYEKTFTVEDRPVKRVTVMVADVPNPDCGFTNVEYLRKATEKDFHKHLHEITANILHAQRQKEEAMAIFGAYLKDTSNFHITD